MPLVLIADRFVREEVGGDGRAFDLTTAAEVRLVERRDITTSDRARAAWRDACQQALAVWHSDRDTLIDYAEVGGIRAVEAYAAPPREVASGASITMHWLPQAATEGVCAAFEDDRIGPLRRFFVRAPPGAGLTSWLSLLARWAGFGAAASGGRASFGRVIGP
jgi:hypothetical protein